MNVPRIIHQTISNPSKLTSAMYSNINNMKSKNSNWEYRLYSGKDRLSYIERNFPNSIITLYRNIDERYGAARADLFRYLVIKKEGGVYLDIKSTFVKPLDEIIEPHDRFVTSNWPQSLDGTDISDWGFHRNLTIKEFPNCFLISDPEHPVVTTCLEKVLENIADYRPLRDGVGRLGVLNLTGPIPYTESILPYLQTDLVRVSSFQELGFRYTFYPYKENLHFELSDNSHYTKLLIPIIHTSRSKTLLIQCYFGFRKLATKFVSKLAL